MSARCRYTLLGALEWREVDGTWVVLCCASGALQTVDAVGAALLSLLEEGPASAEDLTSRLAQAAGSQLPIDANAGVAERLQHWHLAGWVELVDG